jgi:two-component system sporulation sensor kinase B
MGMVIMDFSEILLHFFIIFVPILIYQLLWTHEKFRSVPIKDMTLLFFCCLITAILCSMFPIMNVNGFSVDFRSIIIMYSFLYGSRWMGIWLMVFSTLFGAFVSDNTDLVISLFQLPFFYAAPFLIANKWKSYSVKRKYLASILISFSGFILFFINVFLSPIKVPIEQYTAKDVFLSLIIYVLSFFLLVYFTEFFLENSKLKKAVQDSEKMSVVSELAASIAHEVRNPLTVVKGFIQLIEKEESTKNKHYMKLVLTELERAESLISDYLNLAKKTEIKKEPINISEMMKSVQSVMRSYSNIHNILINSDIEEGLTTLGDVSKIKQIFYNLLKNAIESIPGEHGRVDIKVYGNSQFIFVEIEDNGIGMSEEEINRIGEPFYTKKETGTGLGIMVSKAIIREHGGSIIFKSKKNIGTKVIVTIPVTTD